MEIRNSSQQLLAVVRGNSVYDGRGIFLGSIDSRGTFDASGRMVSIQQVPALLIR